jgi:hypothetical protein
VLDWITHRPDLALSPWGATRVGLGLWYSIPGTIAVETAIFAAGIWIYAACTRARDRIGRYALWIFVMVLYLSYIGNAFGPPPPSAEFLAWFGFGAWIFPLWAWWLDRHRLVIH